MNNSALPTCFYIQAWYTVASLSSSNSYHSLAKQELWNVILDTNVMAEISAGSLVSSSFVHLDPRSPLSLTTLAFLDSTIRPQFVEF